MADTPSCFVATATAGGLQRKAGARQHGAATATAAAVTRQTGLAARAACETAYPPGATPRRRHDAIPSAVIAGNATSTTAGHGPAQGRAGRDRYPRAEGAAHAPRATDVDVVTAAAAAAAR